MRQQKTHQVGRHNKRNRKVTGLPIGHGVWKKNFDQQKKVFGVWRFSVQYRLGLGQRRSRLARSLAWASGRSLLSYACGFRFGIGWVWVFSTRQSKNRKNTSSNPHTCNPSITYCSARFFPEFSPFPAQFHDATPKKLSIFEKNQRILAKKVPFLVFFP